MRRTAKARSVPTMGTLGTSETGKAYFTEFSSFELASSKNVVGPLDDAERPVTTREQGLLEREGMRHAHASELRQLGKVERLTQRARGCPNQGDVRAAALGRFDRRRFVRGVCRSQRSRQCSHQPQ